MANERTKVVAACYARSKQKLPYWNDFTGTGYGCSDSVRMILYDAGHITKEERDDPNSLWAAQGKTKVLDDPTRFQKLSADTKLIPSDIIMYLWHHVSINIEGGTKIFEAAPHLNSRGQVSHPLSDDGGEVGIYSGHSYNCAGVPVTAIYRIIEEGEYKMKNTELMKTAADICDNYPTSYRGTSGSTEAKYNIGAWDGKAFCFDCSGLPKAIMWGWSGNKNASYGGAVYCSNGVPDINDAGFYQYCNMQPITDWSTVAVGECVHKDGHVGLYEGNGKVIECTPAFAGGVQRTVASTRGWTSHGKIPWIDYDTTSSSSEFPTIKNGATGTYVKQLQQILNQKISAGLAVDGSFGPLTETAVKKYQETYGLYVDGIVGPQTWASLSAKEETMSEPELTAEEILDYALRAVRGEFITEYDHHKHKLKEFVGENNTEKIQSVINLAFK